MNAQDVGSVLRGDDRGGDRAAEAGVGLAAVEGADEAFAARAYENGCAQGLEVADVCEDGEVVGEAFAEAYAGIEGNSRRIDASGVAGRKPGSEVGFDLRDGVSVARVVLHGFGAPLRVHEDEIAAEARRSLQRVRAVCECADVVPDIAAGLDAGAGDFGLAGVDGEDRFLVGVGEGGADGLDHGDGAAEFLSDINGLRARSRALAADVEDVGTLLHHAAGLGDGALDGGVAAAVAEAVGGDVEDTHYARHLREWLHVRAIGT